MDKEIVIEPAELTAEEAVKAEEAKKAFAKRVKEVFTRAPVADCGIFANWEAKKNGLIPEDETDDDTEE